MDIVSLLSSNKSGLWPGELAGIVGRKVRGKHNKLVRVDSDYHHNSMGTLWWVYEFIWEKNVTQKIYTFDLD